MDRMKQYMTMKISINGKWLAVCSLIYLYLSLLIFFVTWTKWYIALLAIGATIYGCISIMKDYAPKDQPVLHVYSLALISVFLLMAGLVSGWGGWMTQWADWAKHNALLNDLVNYDWPVYYREAANPSMLTYYIGQYLVPALIGKVTGSFRVAEVMMYIWGEVGLFLIAFQLMRIMNASMFAKQVCVVVILVGFGGCLFLSEMLLDLFSGIAGFDKHWMTAVNGSVLQYRNHYVNLSWVMPQCIAAWLTVSLWWERRKKISVYIPLMLPSLLYGAFSFLGIALMAMICAIYESILEKRSLIVFVKQAFSPANIASMVAVGIPLLLYFSGNVFSAKDPSAGFSIQHINIWLYVSFCLGHFGIYALLSGKRHLQNGMFIAAVILLSILPFFKIGYYNDLVMSTSIPAIFVIMICVIDTIYDKPDSFAAGALCVCLAISALYPMNDLKSAVYLNRIDALDHDMSVPSLITTSDRSSEQMTWKYNYYSYNVDNNLFIEMLARKPFR